MWVTSVPAQVLCITHLPQVAVFGHRHLNVKKTEGADGRLVTRVNVLRDHDEEDEEGEAGEGGTRLREIASMLHLGEDSARDLMRAAVAESPSRHG